MERVLISLFCCLSTITPAVLSNANVADGSLSSSTLLLPPDCVYIDEPFSNDPLPTDDLTREKRTFFGRRKFFGNLARCRPDYHGHYRGHHGTYNHEGNYYENNYNHESSLLPQYDKELSSHHNSYTNNEHSKGDGSHNSGYGEDKSHGSYGGHYPLRPGFGLGKYGKLGGKYGGLGGGLLPYKPFGLHAPLGKYGYGYHKAGNYPHSSHSHEIQNIEYSKHIKDGGCNKCNKDKESHNYSEKPIESYSKDHVLPTTSYEQNKPNTGEHDIKLDVINSSKHGESCDNSSEEKNDKGLCPPVYYPKALFYIPTAPINSVTSGLLPIHPFYSQQAVSPQSFPASLSYSPPVLHVSPEQYTLQNSFNQFPSTAYDSSFIPPPQYYRSHDASVTADHSDRSEHKGFDWNNQKISRMFKTNEQIHNSNPTSEIKNLVDLNGFQQNNEGFNFHRMARQIEDNKEK